ncbi:MAG: DNA polymerase I [Alphaproteobacteria bacterium GM7ARS4]|nr:DNA polymerase I [Alphaproteobacteria bacterium GM7ARS4]
MAESSISRLILIDGSGYIFRAFYALPMMTRRDGLPVNAVYGFTRMVLNIILHETSRPGHGDGRHRPAALGVIFDSKGKSFRNDIYPAYKENRPSPPEALVPQFSWIKKVPQAFNLEAVEKEGYEADDVIATYAYQARQQNIPVTIYSSDKDLMQLVGAGITLFDPVKNREIGEEQVREKFGVPPEKVIEVMALSGDSSDNVPGVPGIGPKTASQLIETFGTLESLLGQADTITQPQRRQRLMDYAQQARLSKELVTLCLDVPVERDFSIFAFKPLEREKLLSFLQELEFKRIMASVKEHFGDDMSVKAEDATSGATAVTSAQRTQGCLSFESSSPSTGHLVATQTEHILIEDKTTWERYKGRLYEQGIWSLVPQWRTSSAGNKSGRSKHRATLLGVALGIEENTAREQGALSLFIPLDEEWQGRDAIWGQLKALMEDECVAKVAYDVKALFHGMAQCCGESWCGRAFEDVMVMAYGAEGGHVRHHWQAFMERMRLTVGDDGCEEDDNAPPHIVYGRQALHVMACYRHIYGELLRCRTYGVYHMLEKPLIAVLAAMERAGVAVDASCLHALTRQFEEEQKTWEESIFQEVGHRFLLGSPQQLSRVLFEELSLPTGRKGKSGVYSTDSGVLEDLSQQGYGLADKILAWRRLAKLRSTYSEALVRYIDDGGRIHSQFSQVSTNTGRLSSLEPNVQNIPMRRSEGRALREAFIAHDGYLVMSADYSQIELRILALMADVKVLQSDFVDGVDIHTRTAAKIFSVAERDVDADKRRKAKAINFGIIYGMSAFGLARQLKIGQADAQDAIDAFFRIYPEIKTYMETQIALCRERGYVTTLFGRRCFMPDIRAKHAPVRHFAERAAINAPIQGTAADIIKKAMIRIHGALKGQERKARMVLQVHDELVFEVQEGHCPSMAHIIEEHMVRAPFPFLQRDMSLVVDVGWGRHWGDAHA